MKKDPIGDTARRLGMTRMELLKKLRKATKAYFPTDGAARALAAVDRMIAKEGKVVAA